MTNQSIKQAFQRFWEYVTAKINDKADAEHVHSWNDLEDRPFYTTDPVETLVLDETQVVVTVFAEGYPASSDMIKSPFEFDEKSPFNVVFDGTLYEGLSMDENGDIGASIVGENLDFSNYPFIMSIQENPFLENPPMPSLVSIVTADIAETTHSVKIYQIISEVYQLDEKYIPDKVRVGKIVTGETFTINGYDVVADENAEIFNGESNIATGFNSHAEGSSTTATGNYSHAEGQFTIASGENSHAEGFHAKASGYVSHAEGQETTASGRWSHAEGFNTIATGMSQHVQGEYNIEDTENKYAHIVGNGTEYNKLSNAHTLDWNGNAWFAGKVLVGGTSQDDAKELGTSDWNQNDETAPDYVKNRSHWVEITETTLLDNANVKYNETYPITGSFIVGNTYTIIFDGVEYIRTCNQNEQFGCHIGNASLVGMGEDNGDKFFIVPVPNTDGQIGMFFETNDSHTMTIIGNSETIHKIDEKYIPSHIIVGRVGEGASSTKFNAISNIASGDYSHAEGLGTTASGEASHAEGLSTIASGEFQHVQGKCNIEDTEGKYAHIVGNGINPYTGQSNAHTLDWDGNAWYQGSVEATALILKSPNGTRFQITIGDDGVLIASEITE